MCSRGALLFCSRCAITVLHTVNFVDFLVKPEECISEELEILQIEKW